MTHNPEDWNAKNVVAGINALRGKRRGGLRVTDDISDTDFQINTNEALRFLAGYVGNLLDRVEQLEADASKHNERDEH